MSHDVHQVRSFEHPGEGRKRAKATPKGRQIDPTAAHDIERLLGDRPRRRDLLIEHLHLIQDKYHQISAGHLAALAEEMKLSFAEVFETATFYAHFDIVKEGQPDIAPLTIRVCDSLTCAMLGGEKLLQDLQDSAGPTIRVVRAPCVGRCDTAPAAEVGHNFVDHARVIISDVRRALSELGGARDAFDLVFVDAPFKDDMSAEVLTLLTGLDLVAPGGWIVVEQSKRAPDAPPAPSGHERVLVATIGDHRIAFYRRPSAAPDDN